MNVRFYNANICTMENGPAVMQGELWTLGNRVYYAGSASGAPPALLFDKQIDLGGNLILPGFKNAHTHSAMTFLRSYADDFPLLEWLDKQVFPMEAKLTGEDVYWLSKLAILEYLSSGITANFDMYMFLEENAQASIDTGFRTVLCGALSNFTGSLQTLENDFLHFNALHERISYQLSFHAEYTCSRQLLEGVADLADRYQSPVYTHNSETLPEVQQCIARNGTTPTAYLNQLGIFNYGGGGFHCVHMSDEDLKITKDRGLYVVSNPGSNSKLASGIAPVQKMLNMGIPVALGTDGPASNNALDMFREMYLATVLQKLSLQDAAALNADTVLEMACCTGARAMGLPNCDNLAVGKLADLIVIDLQQPNMQPLNNLTRNLVYSGSKQNVKLTMVNGQILYQNGEYFVGTNPAEIYAKANEIIRRMQQQ
ncbi:amidohydrolase [Ruminococcaceae bacterium OttesenSCG-928-A16]|nr:amidohydrolase [Ruminococcaceae bacterium OttesenSCG-928-A16]